MKIQLQHIFVPGLTALILGLFGIYGADQVLRFDPAFMPVLSNTPYVLSIIGAILCLWFHQSRLLYAFCILGLSAALTQSLFLGGPDQGVDGQVLFAALATLLPVNIAALTFHKQRALLSTTGLMRIGLILGQVVGIYYCAFHTDWRVHADVLHFRLVPASYDTWTWLPQPAIISSVLAGIVLLLRVGITGKPLDGAGFVAVALTTLAFHAASAPVIVALFFTLSIFVLVIALVQDAYHMAFLDELTGLPGRRALMSTFNGLGSRYVVAMLDVDHFKKFNDTYGHDVGDQVLKMVATCLGNVTGGGKAFRYGGEEFTIVFPRRRASEVKVHLESVRESVAAASFQLRSDDRPMVAPENPIKKSSTETVHVTISIGYTEKNADHAKPMDVMKSADEALYRAKDGGRNCTSE